MSAPITGRRLIRPLQRHLETIDERLGAAPFMKTALRYVFPDHWSFLLGEVALYSFVFLVLSGTFLAFFYNSSIAETTYGGPYGPLKGIEGSEAYFSVINICFGVPAGLLIRQAHHWAADIFVVSIVMHVLRVLFTGAYRKPRDLNYYIGLLILMLALPEGLFGYSMVDDLLSGMGLVIAYAAFLSFPVLGGTFTFLFWGGEYPGSYDFLTRLFFVHVFIIPILIGILIAAHLGILMRQHHSQFKEPGHKEMNTVGTPMWPAYALRSLGLMCAVFAVLLLLGGLVQINPIWEWGPYEVWQSTNAAQPDWYLGWLIGALRVMPPLEVHFAARTWIPNPFWGGLLFPLVVFAILFMWPSLERKLTRDKARHDLLDRPRDHPQRTALLVMFTTWVFVIFFAGASDRLNVRVGLGYEGQIWFWRFFCVIIPIVMYFVTVKVCRELRDRDAHPFRGFDGTIIRRNDLGGYSSAPPATHRPPGVPHLPARGPAGRPGERPRLGGPDHGAVGEEEPEEVEE